MLEPAISKAAAAYYAEQSARVAPDLPSLEHVLRLLRREPAQLANLSIEKRVSLARTCLAWLNITLDDLRKFYATHFTRDNVVIGLGGGYDAALLGRLQRLG